MEVDPPGGGEGGEGLGLVECAWLVAEHFLIPD